MSKTLPACFSMYYRMMSEKTRDLGYALTLHGSLLRDADMVAIPWTDRAVEPEELVKELALVTGGYLHETPASKPHGRLAYVIYLGDGPYIDLSVMPKRTA